MKSLFENWRKFRNEEKEEVLEEELIQEFKESDKAAILEAGERFTISYEIELLSNQSAGAAGRGDLPTLEQFARNYLDQDYFDQNLIERELSDFYEYNFLEDYIVDSEGLVDKYVDEEGTTVKSCWRMNKNGVLTIAKTKQEEWKKRIDVLKDTIQYWIDYPVEKTVEIIQLFY